MTETHTVDAEALKITDHDHIDMIMEVITGLGILVNANAVSHDFYDTDAPYNFGEKIALMHSELSEGLEAHRKDKVDDHLPEFEGWVVEFADVLIRMLDTLHHHNNVAQFVQALVAKHNYNCDRPRKHGGKKY